MKLPFEFCALRFFLLWKGREKSFHREMKGTLTFTGLRQSLSHFKVARNFPGLKDNGNAQSIVDSLTSVESRDDASSEQKVEELAHCFKANFKQFNLSAASKLFWLRHTKPDIIYDTHTILALDELQESFDPKSYSEYSQAWRKQNRLHREDIKQASSRLTEIRSVLPSWHVDAKSMLRLVMQSWFLERVFVIYLWELGAVSANRVAFFPSMSGRYRGLTKDACRVFKALAPAYIYLACQRLMAQVRP